MGMLGGMMGSRMGRMDQQMSGNASGFGGGYNNMNAGGADPGGSMAMSGGGLDAMGSIQKINDQTVTSQVNQNGGMGGGGVGFNNPVGGMLGSIFRVF
jgi:hypothetical protein